MTHSNLTTNQEIYLVQELWLMDKYEVPFISSIFVSVALLLVYKFRKAEWFCWEKDDDNLRAEAEKGFLDKCMMKCMTENQWKIL